MSAGEDRPLALRPAGPDDYPRLAALWIHAFGKDINRIFGEQGPEVLPDMFHACPQLCAGTTLACAGELPVGYIQLSGADRSGWGSAGRVFRVVRRRFGWLGAVRRMLLMACSEVGHWYGSADLYVYMLGVDPAWRGRGVGRRLLESAEEEARRAGKRFLRLGVVAGNEPAITLYKRFGFSLGPLWRLFPLNRINEIPGFHIMKKPIEINVSVKEKS